MRSRTFFFNRTVFWCDCRRWWPLTAGYALLWLLLLPLSRLTEYSYSYAYSHAPPSAWNILYHSLGIAATGGYISAFCAGILFAMAAFSYLTNPRATNGLHALPARRETLYVTHYLAGLCSQLAPQALAVALTAAVLGSRGAFDARVTGLMLLALALPTLFFYSFGVFCLMFTGQILAAPVFYGVLNILVVGVETLVRAFAGNFLYGWAEEQTPVLFAFSPIVKLIENGVRADGVVNAHYASGEPTLYPITLYGLNWLLVYAAAGLVFAALGLLLYRARHSEATGNTVAIGWARPVFKYGVAFCAALALGQLVYHLFFGQYRSNGRYSLAGSLICMAAAGLLGYFGAEMLLKKSFRVWKGGWRGAVAVMAALVTLGCCMTFDLTGYEGYIPNLDSVERVGVDINIYASRNDCYVVSGDPDTIRLAAAAHRAVISDKQRQQDNEKYNTPGDRSDSSIVGGYFTITYRLKNGSSIRRRYRDVTLYAGELNDPASPAAALTALYNDPGVMVKRALGRDGFIGENDPRALNDLRFTGGYYSRSKRAGERYPGENRYDLTPAQAQLIYDSVLRDAAAGHVRESLFEDDVQMVGLQLYATYLNTRDHTGSTEPTLDGNGRTQIEFDVTITPRMTETLATLRAMDIEVAFD